VENTRSHQYFINISFLTSHSFYLSAILQAWQLGWMHATPLITLSLLFHVHSIFAARLPFEARSVKRVIRLQDRASISGGGNGSVSITNTHNAEYIANITLGGQSIPVMLDTGRYVTHISIRMLGTDPSTVPICGSPAPFQVPKIQAGRLHCPMPLAKPQVCTTHTFSDM